MFRGFANVWTIVGTTRDLGPAPLALQVAGERVVLFRDATGVARGLLDRCPHRGVQLSLGRVVDGCLECPFHGWRFAGDGSNCAVPWNPDARRERLAATPVPVCERGGLLWLYTAPGADAPSEPDVPELLTRPGMVVCAWVIDWKTHWTRAMENMLDWPHLPFIHRGTIGHNLPHRPGARMDITWEDRPWGGHTTIAVDGAPQPGALDYRFPNAMQLWIPMPRRTLGLMTVCLPIDDRTTRMILLTIRDFLRPRIFDRLFHWSNRRVATEDQAVLESSDPPEVPAPGDERSVRTDEPTLRFRKIYRERLQGSSAARHGLHVVA
jgi:nitrite reductase/ring-hydroxylating ferredoxin subunit